MVRSISNAPETPASATSFTSFCIPHLHHFIHPSSTHPSIHLSILLLIHLFIIYLPIQPSVNLSVHLLIHPSSTHPSIDLSTIHQPINRSTHPLIQPCIHPPNHPSTYLSVCSCTHPPIYLSIHPSFYRPSIHPSLLFLL